MLTQGYQSIHVVPEIALPVASTIVSASVHPRAKAGNAIRKRIDEVKWHLAECIEARTRQADYVPVMVALLEMFVDRFAETHGRKEALEVINRELR
jgi:hypothetical protein